MVKNEYGYFGSENQRKTEEFIQNGAIKISKTIISETNSFEGPLKIVLLEENFTDGYLENLKNGIIFSLLCDFAKNFQALSNFKEARFCLKKAETLFPNSCKLFLLSGLNLFLNLDKHSPKNLEYALSLVEKAIFYVQNDTEKDGISGNFIGIFDRKEFLAFALKLKEEIKISIKEANKKITVFLQPLCKDSFEHLKFVLSQKQHSKEDDKLFNKKKRHQLFKSTKTKNTILYLQKTNRLVFLPRTFGKKDEEKNDRVIANQQRERKPALLFKTVGPVPKFVQFYYKSRVL